MHNKFYSLPSLSLKIESEDKIEDNSAFLPFIVENCDADLCIKLIKGSLPKAQGKLIFSDSYRSYYLDGDMSRYYSSYFKDEKDEYVPYACLENCREKNILYISFDGGLWDKMIFDALNIPDILLKKGSALIHSSLINANGYGIIFIGNKGDGKSTQADLWAKHRNARIINGDRAIINSMDGKIFVGGSPMCGSSSFALNENVPLKAIVTLKKGSEDSVSALPIQLAFTKIVENITYSHELQDITERAVDVALELVGKIPVYELVCTPTQAAVEVLEKELWK